MGKPSMRPDWRRRQAGSKNTLHHQSIRNNASTRAGKPGEDFGPDNFTYDPETLSRWQLPNHLAVENLPKALYEASKDMTLAGAAIDTALERIQGLFGEAASHAFPAFTHDHLFKRVSEQCPSRESASQPPSLQWSVLTPASTPAMSSRSCDPPSSPTKPDTSIEDMVKNVRHPNQLPDAITSKPGMESPPFTPITRSGPDSGSGACSPAMLLHDQVNTVTIPDFVQLSAQLSPLISPSSYSFPSTFDAPDTQPDILAWSTYLSACQAELNSLRASDLPRLRGHAYTVQKLLFEMRAQPPKDLTWSFAETIVSFAAWWNEAQNLSQDREQAAASLQLPKLEDVVAGA